MSMCYQKIELMQNMETSRSSRTIKISPWTVLYVYMCPANDILEQLGSMSSVRILPETMTIVTRKIGLQKQQDERQTAS